MKKVTFASLLFLASFSFLFLNTSRAEAATLYFFGPSDHDWNTLTNWWTDAGFTSQALSLPGVGDDVVIQGTVNGNSGPDPSVNTLTMSGTADFNVAITVANGATFNGYTISYTVITGNATFNGYSQNIPNGVITGNAIFNDSSSNRSTVSGNATFNDSSINSGTGVVSSNACFASTATNSGSVVGATTACSVSIPTVTTIDPISVTNSTEAFVGLVSNTGGQSVATVGFDYGPDTDYGTTVSKNGAFTGAFNSMIRSLTCNTPYHFRAFATNTAGTGYGSDVLFTTASCTPSSTILYGIDGSGSNSSAPQLYTIDPATGDILTDIGPVGFSVTGMAFHPDTQVLYGVSGGSNSGAHPKSLVTINTSTGAGTWQGTMKDSGNVTRNMTDLSFRSNGTLYGWANDTQDLYTIDLTSCNGTSDTICLVTQVGDFVIQEGLGFGDALAFDSTDHLLQFGNSDKTYYEVDPDTGKFMSEVIFENSSGVDHPMNAATFNENDVVFVARLDFSDPGDLIIIDQNTGSIISTTEDNPDMTYMDAIAFYIPPIVTHDLSYLAGAGGTLTGDVSQTVNDGEDGAAVTAIADEGYHFVDWSDAVTDNPRTDTGVTEDIEVTANFEIDPPEETHHSGSGSVSGSIAPFVLNTINSNLTPLPLQAPMSTSSIQCTIVTDLKKGGIGEQVKCLQEKLNVLYNQPPLVIDGIFGSKTKAAVITFQKDNSLVQDGIVGPLTRAALLK